MVERRGRILSWDDVRYFLAVATTGSSNAAARELGLDHTTVSRRVRELQANLGTRLFERRGNRMTLTPIGIEALAEARTMDEAAHAFARKIRGSDGDLSGTIRLNVTEGLGTYWLMPKMQPFLLRHPRIEINWLTTNTVVMNVHRECDVALWWKTPDSPSVVGRKLGSVRYSLFTTLDYVNRFGAPGSAEDFASHRFIHYNGYEINPGLGSWNALMRRFPPAMRVENTLATETIMNTNMFIALLPDYVKNFFPSYVNLPLELGISIDVWLVYHEDRRRDPMVKAVVQEVGRLARESKGSWFS